MAWTRINVRLPRVLDDAVREEAQRVGVTQSEATRQALAVWVTWHRALDAVDEGARTGALRDPAVMLGRLLDQ